MPSARVQIHDVTPVPLSKRFRVEADQDQHRWVFETFDPWIASLCQRAMQLCVRVDIAFTERTGRFGHVFARDIVTVELPKVSQGDILATWEA